jgi:hypothetical protein
VVEVIVIYSDEISGRNISIVTQSMVRNGYLFPAEFFAAAVSQHGRR